MLTVFDAAIRPPVSLSYVDMLAAQTAGVLRLGDDARLGLERPAMSACLTGRHGWPPRARPWPLGNNPRALPSSARVYRALLAWCAQ